MFLHSPGAFIEFERGEIEQSISDRFEKQVERFPDSPRLRLEIIDSLTGSSTRKRIECGKPS
jgi:hypothetical protein